MNTIHKDENKALNVSVNKKVAEKSQPPSYTLYFIL